MWIAGRHPEILDGSLGQTANDHEEIHELLTVEDVAAILRSARAGSTTTHAHGAFLDRSDCPCEGRQICAV
jgi:hypothetical protein